MISDNLNSLPLYSHLPNLVKSYFRTKALVLEAQPGAGKTTLLPLALTGLIPTESSPSKHTKLRLIMVEPRRLAAASAAYRMSEILGEDAGKSVGFRTKYESTGGPQTSLLVVTEGILLNLILADPLLEDWDCVVFDEFHERSSAADLALALCVEARKARGDLGLVIMSATLQLAQTTDYLIRVLNLPNLEGFSLPGRQFPVTTEYLPALDREGFDEHVVRGILKALQTAVGNLLVFLPGVGEIQRTRRLLEPRLQKFQSNGPIEVLTLYGDMDWKDQKKVIAPSTNNRRVILATSIAETSLTIPGVSTVIDGGLSRFIRFQPHTGMNRLVTERVCLDSSLQRQGRAGRMQHGHCIKLWASTETLLPFLDPELKRSELSGLVLAAAAWGSIDRQALPWFLAPPEGTWAEACDRLQQWEALTNLRITPLGIQMLGMGLDPRLARLALSGNPTQTAVLVALLSEGDFLSQRDNPNMEDRLLLLEQGKAPAGHIRTRDDILRRLEKLSDRKLRFQSPVQDTGQLIALAYPDRVARLLPPSDPLAPPRQPLYQFPSGRVAALSGGHTPQALVAPEVDAGTSTGRIRWFYPLDLDTFLNEHGHLLHQELEVEWTQTSPQSLGIPRIRQKSCFGALVLKVVPLRPLPPEPLEKALGLFIQERWAELPWSPETQQWIKRCQLAFPNWSSETLQKEWKTWLGIPRADSGILLTAGQLAQALKGRLSWDQAKQLEVLCPASFLAPSGMNRPIRYPEDSPPTLSIKLQELFGLAQGPTAGGQPVRLELLSPAGRPVQITDDLVSFWKNTYPQVRKDLKGRYPRHPWPEDPWNAQATHRVKPKGF